jgi:AraC-like DNA-binding protein
MKNAVRRSNAPTSGSLRRWLSPGLPGFAICYCDRVEYKKSQRYVFDTFTLTLVEDGVGSFIRGRRTVHSAGSGSIAVSSPGDVIAADSGNGAFTCRSLYLSPAFLDQLTADGGGGSRAYEHTFAAPQPGNPQMFELLLEATAALGTMSDGLERETRLLTALRRFAQGPAEEHALRSRGERHAVRRAKEVLLDRLDENLSLDELATVADLNKFHLLRMFRQELGLPPHLYRMHARIGRARTLISEGHTALEASLRTGFSDQAHFARVFKRLVGLTPSRYRLNVLGDEVNFVLGGR